MKLSFKPIKTEQEIKYLADLAYEIWHEFFVSILTNEQIDYIVDKFQSVPAMTELIRNQGYEYYFLNLNGINAGYVGIKQEEGKLFLSKLYIQKEHRGKRLASQTMDFLISICKEKSIDKIWLTVNRYNDNTIAVYKEMGFKIISTKVADIGNGFVMDDYIMELEFQKSILLLQRTTKEQLEILQEIIPEYRLLKGWEEDELDLSLENIEIIYGWNHKYKFLIENPDHHLKWIQAITAGVDYMDMNLLKERNIRLTNAGGLHAKPIAESVFAMLLSYTRGIQYSVKNQSCKRWQPIERLIELDSCTMMIVGAGKIGIEVGRIAKSFGIKTIGVNLSGKDVEYMDKTIKQGEVEGNLKDADIVVNILPLTDFTIHYFNEKLFSQMKNGTIFINVGRGKSVKTEDLIAALDLGKVAFAGLDVFETEPLPAYSELWERDDVLITPHISGIVSHFKTRVFDVFERNLINFLENGNPLVNLIDYDKKY